MIVAKFGGTSINTKEKVLSLCNIVSNELGRQPVVIVSALRGVTDLLLSLPNLPKSRVKKELKKLEDIHLNLAEELWEDREIRKKVKGYVVSKVKEVEELLKKKDFKNAFLDKLASYGEIISSYMITQAFQARGTRAQQIVATDLIITDNNFGSAEVLIGPTKKNAKKILLPLLKKGIVPVVTGFIGSTKSGQVTTLGRGGSDYTASIIGFCLGVSEIQIWTDVDGVFTADPRVVETARPLPTVSFKEASELAAFGTRVLHPRTIRPAISAKIPVKVLNTISPQSGGTLIEEKNSEAGTIKAVSFKRKIILVNIYATEMLSQKGFLARIFKVFAYHNISLDLVSVSEVSVSVTLDHEENLMNATKEISEFASVTIFKDLGMVSLLGEGITSSTGNIRKIFDILDKEKILARMISLSASNINISIIVPYNQVEQAVKVLHDRLLLGIGNHKKPNSGTIASN